MQSGPGRGDSFIAGVAGEGVAWPAVDVQKHLVLLGMKEEEGLKRVARASSRNANTKAEGREYHLRDATGSPQACQLAAITTCWAILLNNL